MDKNLLPNDFSTGCLVSIFTVRINSKSFPWPVHSVQETSLPNIFLRHRTRVDARQITMTSLSCRQPVTIDYWVTWVALGRVECRK